MKRSHACTGSPTTRGPLTARENAATDIAFRLFRRRRHPKHRPFRGSIAGLRAPLSTLRCTLTGHQRMTRGHRGSLLLRCRDLSTPSPCRFIPALSESERPRRSSGASTPLQGRSLTRRDVAIEQCRSEPPPGALLPSLKSRHLIAALGSPTRAQLAMPVRRVVAVSALKRRGPPVGARRARCRRACQRGW